MCVSNCETEVYDCINIYYLFNSVYISTFNYYIYRLVLSGMEVGCCCVLYWYECVW